MSDQNILKPDFFKPIEDKFISHGNLDKSIFEKEASFAIQHLTKNPYLQKASPSSILKAVLNISQTGLTLNPVSKYAYLVPRYNSSNKTLECVLDPSYTGLVKLLTDSGSVKSISCQIVHEGDDIIVDMASEKKIIKHTPYMFSGNEKGGITCVYSLATIHDGSFHCEIMSIKDVYEIRERSESFKAFKAGKAKSSIWNTDESEMIRKTCIKRHFKHLPKSGNLDFFERAIDLSHVSSGFAEPVSYTSIGLIESLIKNCNLSEQEKDRIESDLYNIEYEHQAKKLISHLRSNEQILGWERLPHSQKEIQQLTKMKADLDK